MPIVSERFNQSVTSRANLGYRLFVPAAAGETPGEPRPLILFLHGVKKRGGDLSLLDDYGLLGAAARAEAFPCFVLAPQCPSFSDWPAQRAAVLALLDHIVDTRGIDRERIYVTGFSMGGNGTWDLAVHAGDRFAAAAPLAGWFEPEAAPLLESMPIWAFHGEADETIPIARTEEMAAAIGEAGGTVRFTRLPGLGHQIMAAAYDDGRLVDWLLAHRVAKL